jgi:hypothetical protein
VKSSDKFKLRAENLRLLRQVIFNESQEDFAKRISHFHKQGDVSLLETEKDQITDIRARDLEKFVFKDLKLADGWLDLPFAQLLLQISKEEFDLLLSLKSLPKSSTNTLMAFLESLK